MSHHALFLTTASWALICGVIAWLAPVLGFPSAAPIAWMAARTLFVVFALYAIPLLLIRLANDERLAQWGHRLLGH